MIPRLIVEGVLTPVADAVECIAGTKDCFPGTEDIDIRLNPLSWIWGVVGFLVKPFKIR